MTTFGKILVWTIAIIIILIASSVYYFKFRKTAAAEIPNVATVEATTTATSTEIIATTSTTSTQTISTSSTSTDSEQATTTYVASDYIKVTSPEKSTTVTSPLTIKGQARGVWFFKGEFPIELTDGDGNTIATTSAESDADWEDNDDFETFTATLNFKTASTSSGKANLILEDNNVSSLRSKIKSIQIPVILK